MKVGPTKYCKRETETAWSHYQETGETALVLMDDDGSVALKATVCPPSGNLRAGHDWIWLKGWSENEGVVDALVKAGVVTLMTNAVAQCGHQVALAGKLTEAAQEELDAHYAADSLAFAARAEARGRP